MKLTSLLIVDMKELLFRLLFPRKYISLLLLFPHSFVYNERIINKGLFSFIFMIEFLFALALIWVVFAVVQDFKTREVANWLNFSLIIFALAVRAFWSISTNTVEPILFGFTGLIVGFVVAHLFYYSRIFAGGDAKLLIALCVVIPIANDFYTNSLIFLLFFISFLFFGAIYSLGFSIVLSLMNWKNFKKDFSIKHSKNMSYNYLAFFISLLFFVLFFIYKDFLILGLAVLILLFPYLYYFLKSVESASLIKEVSVEKLTEGDWLVEDIHVGSRIIRSNWEGVSKEELEFIRKHCNEKIKVRYGVPFTPSFLIALIFLIAIHYLGGDWGFWRVF